MSGNGTAPPSTAPAGTSEASAKGNPDPAGGSGKTGSRQREKASPEAVQRACMEILEEYRKGRVEKSACVARVTTILWTHVSSDITSADFTAPYGRYLALIDAVAQAPTGSGSRAEIVPPVSTESAQATPSQSTIAQSGANKENTAGKDGDSSGSEHEIDAHLHESRSGKRKRHTHKDEPDSSDDSSDSEGNGTLNPQFAPWINDNDGSDSAGANVHVDIRRSNEALRYFARRPKKALQSLIRKTGLTDFPTDQYKAILQGRPVDLDVVYSAIYSWQANTKRTAKLANGLVLELNETIATKEVATFGQCGMQPAEHIRKSSLGEETSSPPTANISKNSALSSTKVSLDGSTPTIRQCDHSLLEQTSIVTPTTDSLRRSDHDISLPQSIKSLSKGRPVKVLRVDRSRRGSEMNCVSDGIAGCVEIPQRAAVTLTSAATAELVTINEAKRGARSEVLPRFLRSLVWEEDAPSFESAHSALTSLEAEPWPVVPMKHRNDHLIRNTIDNNPHLFCVSTRININRFEMLLANHPQPEFVASVCHGLRRGVWPYAMRPEEFPHTYDYYAQHQSSVREPALVQFLESKCEEEMNEDRYSPGFPELLPGMYCMPLHVIVRKGKPRIINNQSGGTYPVNQMIPRDEGHVLLDGLKLLGEDMLRLHWEHPGEKLELFKSDVKAAFRHMPFAPEFQILQIIKIGSSYHVDRHTPFGNRASPRIWCEFFSLVLWIAE